MPEYVCPNCKHADRFAEVNRTIGFARGSFDAKGRFIYDGGTEVDWDSQAPVSEGPRYVCLACNERFNNPAVRAHPESEKKP